ncbi:MAG: hypothetical protein K2X27_14380 [Candidatus Obscuribacterales bacterium]|nr:hypothetical protein [Candidatus Obscuribacterales bacterium]
MDRTLFTPAMIETFRACKRAYELAYIKSGESAASKLSTLCKRFLLKAIAEVNRGKIKSISESQRFIGQHWNSLKIDNNAPEDLQTKSIQAFRFAYRALTSYVSKPYRPSGSEIVAVNTTMRARVPHAGVYLEDVFDMILWHPEEKILEIVDYHLNPLKNFDAAWPAPSILIKQFLCEKLRSRLPFELIRLTFIQIQSQGQQLRSIDLDESVYRLHWPEICESLNEMKSAKEFPPHSGELCKRCNALSAKAGHRGTFTGESRDDVVYRSA